MAVDADESAAQTGDKRKGNIDLLSKSFETEEGHTHTKIVKPAVCPIPTHSCLSRKKWKHYA